MTAPAWEDLSAFLQPEDEGGFAVQAAFSLPDGSGRTPWGIFDDPYLNAQLGEYDADTSQPRFTCKACDVQGVRRKAVAVIKGRTYDVLTDPQDDGAGMVIVKLAPR